METLLHNKDSHSSHDDQWCIVSTDNQLPLCIACLVEHLEEQSLTKVQRQFKLSLLAETIKENEEALRLFRENPLVCQHVLEILTDHYTGCSFLTDSVQICARLMDALQSEELYVYLLDKFQHQLQDGTSVYSFVVGLLEKLCKISTVYVSTLIISHEYLLLLLMEIFNSTNPDEACSCSLLSLLSRLFDEDVLLIMPLCVLPLVEKCLLRSLTSVQSGSVHMNAVALLNCLLKADQCIQYDIECWTELLLGLKRLFVSKKDALVIAATKCLVLIATLPRHGPALRHIVLEDDLSEFLFEALHTVNGAQLEAVFSCLLLFSEHDQFYKKCHAIYGLESVLRSLDVLLATQNVTVVGKGFSLLANMLKRQPSSIPMFVNQSVAELTASVVAKGVCSHAVRVVLPALTAATALCRDSKVGLRGQHQQFSRYKQIIVEAALAQVTRVASSTETCSAASTLSVTDVQFLSVLLDLLSAAVTCGVEEQAVQQQILETCRDSIVPYFSDHFTACDNASFQTMFHFLNTLYKTHEGNLQEVSNKTLASGLATQVLMKKPDFRYDLDLMTSANRLMENMFQSLLKEDSAQCQSLPDYLGSGLGRLSLNSSIHQTASDLWDEDTTAALCMFLYFSCLHKPDLFPSLQIGQVLCQLHGKGMLHCSPQRPTTTKFLLYLLAFASSAEEEASTDYSLQDVERTVVALAVSELSVDDWATPHPDIFIWVFGTAQRAYDLGTPLLEHWLLHTKGAVPTAGDGGVGQDHVVCTLFFNSHFRMVLLNLITSSSEEISVLSRKLLVTLINLNAGRTEEQLIRLLHDEVMSKFHSLFVLSVQPLRQVVNSFLLVLVAMMQHPMCGPSEADHSKQIGVIYHLVHYIGTTDSEDNELLSNGMACLDCLSKSTDEEQDKTVVPVLLQNTSFMQQLERCLYRSEQQTSVALSVAAWISSFSSSNQTDWPITLSAEFILQTITKSSNELAVAALKILYLSLSQSSPSQTSPLRFQRSHSIHQDGLLYTAHELRLLFIYVQQFICSENREIQFFAVKCFLEIYNHSKLFNKAISDCLLHHPWNGQLLRFVLTNTVSSGMQLHTTEFICQIWRHDSNEQSELAKMVLQSVLATQIDAENQDLLLLLVQKAKTVCQDDDLKEQAVLKLAAFENSLSFSQNTVVST